MCARIYIYASAAAATVMAFPPAPLLLSLSLFSNAAPQPSSSLRLCRRRSIVNRFTAPTRDLIPSSWLFALEAAIAAALAVARCSGKGERGKT